MEQWQQYLAFDHRLAFVEASDVIEGDGRNRIPAELGRLLGTDIAIKDILFRSGFFLFFPRLMRILFFFRIWRRSDLIFCFGVVFLDVPEVIVLLRLWLCFLGDRKLQQGIGSIAKMSGKAFFADLKQRVEGLAALDAVDVVIVIHLEESEQFLKRGYGTFEVSAGDARFRIAKKIGIANHMTPFLNASNWSNESGVIGLR